MKQLGNLVSDFAFSQKPRPPKLLPLHPKTTLRSTLPLAPLIRKVTASGPGQVTLVLDIPPSDGGAPILHYRDAVSQRRRGGGAHLPGE